MGFFRLDQNKQFFGYTERSGTPVNLPAPAPVVNVNYQFRGETKALVMICMKPATAPKGKEHELIDNSNGMGFEHRLILPIIKQALFYSIDNECCTCLRWHIKELVEAESGKDEGAVEAIAGQPLEPKVTVTTSFGNFFAKLLAGECLKASSGLVSTRVTTK